MKLTLKEMNGLLNGKCLPSDLIVGETLAEYLVRKFSDLEQKLAVSQREFRAADATIENLAAENAGLKAVCEDRRTFIMNGVQLGYIQVPTVETDPALETIRVAVSPQEPTPATDVFLAEVRASALDEFARAQDEQAKKYYEMSPGCSAQDECQFAAGQAWYFAECIRKGVQS